jgi:hypothetical protein
MSQCGLNDDDRPLTPAWTLAIGQMCREESAHHRFVDTSKRQVLLGEPMRKVSNGVEIRTGDRGGIPVALQIRDVRGRIRAQHTR